MLGECEFLNNMLIKPTRKYQDVDQKLKPQKNIKYETFDLVKYASCLILIWETPAFHSNWKYFELDTQQIRSTKNNVGSC